MNKTNEVENLPEMQNIFQEIISEINRYRELQYRVRTISNIIKPMNACEPLKEAEAKKQEGVIGKMREMENEFRKINNDLDDCCNHLYKIIGS